MGAEYMAYVGLDINDVATFFSVVAGGLDKEIDFEHFVNGCMSMKGGARALEVERVAWDLKKHQRQIERFEVKCMEELRFLNLKLAENLETRSGACMLDRGGGLPE